MKMFPPKDYTNRNESNVKKIRLTKMIILVIFIMIVILGTSYALWSLTLKQSESNTITSGCFKVEFSDKNSITLNDTYPITDEDAKKLTPYEFTLTNTCSSNARYQVNLEILDTTTLENRDYVKVMYNENNSQILSGYEKTDTTLDNAIDSRLLEIGYLETNDSKTFDLRLWLSEETPTSEEFMNKIFESRVTITTSYANKLPGTLRTIASSETSGMWEYKNSITKLVIQNKLSKIDGAVKVSDESLEQNKSIMSYVVPNEDGETYTAYLQGQDIIYLNPDSSNLLSSFSKLDLIDGIKYLDTSRVINMKNLFRNCQNLTTLDLSSFDTSQVTTMSYMFNGCTKLAVLDISSFDTSQVTDMSAMFGSKNLTTIDLSNFNTSKVTNIQNMFAGCSGLTGLDLSNFDTRNVTDMGNMFLLCSNLVSLNISSFDTSKVTNMFGMFNSCSSLTTLDVANFDTSKVTNMGYIFYGCRNLTNIIYGDDFIHMNDSNTTNMFTDCPANKPTHSSWSGVTF